MSLSPIICCITCYIFRSNQPTSVQELSSVNSLVGSKRPRRAAAAAAQAVIQQEAADVLGVTLVPPTAIPEPPTPCSSSPPAVALPAALVAAHQQQHRSQQQQQQSPCSHSGDGGLDQQHSNGSDGVSPAQLTAVEGIPQELLQQIEQAVLETFYWLLAMMVTNPVLTYEFISVDLEEGTQPLPPQDDKMWEDVVTYMQPTLDQLQECVTCIQVGGCCSMCIERWCICGVVSLYMLLSSLSRTPKLQPDCITDRALPLQQRIASGPGQRSGLWC